MKNKNSEKLLIGIVSFFVVAAVILILVAVIMIASKNKVPNTNNYDISSIKFEENELGQCYRQSIGTETDASAMYFVFDETSDAVQIMMGNSVVSSTQYAVDGGIVSVGNYAEKVSYAMIGDMLIQENTISADVVPDGDSFKFKTVIGDEKNGVYKYEFKSDNTLKVTGYFGSGKDKNTYESEGTYTREGDMIYVSMGKVDMASTPYVILDGHLATSVFKSITEDEFDSDMASIGSQAQ